MSAKFRMSLAQMFTNAGATARKATSCQNWPSSWLMVLAAALEYLSWWRWLWNGQWLAGLTSVVKFGKRMISADCEDGV